MCYNIIVFYYYIIEAEMRQKYRFLKKSLVISVICLLAIALMSGICFSFMYDAPTYTLRFPHIVTGLLYFAIIGTVAYSVYFTLKVKSINITRIKKTSRFWRFASTLGAIMMIVFFIYECIVSITKANFQAYFIFRVIRWLLTIPTCIYFVFQAMPNRIKRVKIVPPEYIKVALSVCSIFWCLFGILTTYFSSLTATDIAKISQLFVYASCALFLVFEGKFEIFGSGHKAYFISAFACSALTFGFPFGISVAKIVGKMSPYRAFSQPELILSVVFGIYALSKMFAIVLTMRAVAENSSRSSHSSKFDKKSSKDDSGEGEGSDAKGEIASKSEGEDK